MKERALINLINYSLKNDVTNGRAFSCFINKVYPVTKHDQFDTLRDHL